MDGWDGGRDTFWLTRFMPFALIPIAYYEVAATARRGQTFGKRSMGLEVVRWDKEAASPDRGSGSPGAWRSTVRWAVPHGSGVVAAVVAGTVPTNSGHGAIVGACAWLVVSSAMYLPSLLDANGRGWHDKAAGTVVVTAPNDADA